MADGNVSARNVVRVRFRQSKDLPWRACMLFVFCFRVFFSHFFFVLSVTTTALLVELLHPSHGLEQDLVDGQGEEVLGFTASAVSFVFKSLCLLQNDPPNNPMKISSLIGWSRIVIWRVVKRCLQQRFFIVYFVFLVTRIEFDFQCVVFQCLLHARRIEPVVVDDEDSETLADNDKVSPCQHVYFRVDLFRCYVCSCSDLLPQ